MSVTVFVFPRNVAIGRSLLKLVTLICENTTNGVEVLTITQILRIEVLDKHQFIIIGDAFQYVMNPDEPARHSFSNYLVIEPSGTEIVRLASCIKRHVILCEDNRNLSSPTHLVCVDFNRPDFPITAVSVRYCPVEGDMVLVKGDELEPWRALVQDKNARNRTVKATFYIPHPRWGKDSGFWVHKGTASQNISWKSILGIYKGSWRGQGRGVFREDN